MARYREKSPEDLAWNRTRRRITRDVDTVIADFREDLLNRLLTAGWERYVEALDAGELVQLEDEASLWVRSILDTQLLPAIEAANGDVENA